MSEDTRETVGPPTSAGAEAANEMGRMLRKGISPDFASDEAAEAWTAEGFPPLPPTGSGKGGTITKADVMAAAEED